MRSNKPQAEPFQDWVCDENQSLPVLVERTQSNYGLSRLFRANADVYGFAAVRAYACYARIGRTALEQIRYLYAKSIGNLGKFINAKVVP